MFVLLFSACLYTHTRIGAGGGEYIQIELIVITFLPPPPSLYRDYVVVVVEPYVLFFLSPCSVIHLDPFFYIYIRKYLEDSTRASGLDHHRVYFIFLLF